MMYADELIAAGDPFGRYVQLSVQRHLSDPERVEHARLHTSYGGNWLGPGWAVHRSRLVRGLLEVTTDPDAGWRDPAACGYYKNFMSHWETRLPILAHVDVGVPPGGGAPTMDRFLSEWLGSDHFGRLTFDFRRLNYPDALYAANAVMDGGNVRSTLTELCVTWQSGSAKFGELLYSRNVMMELEGLPYTLVLNGRTVYTPEKGLGTL